MSPQINNEQSELDKVFAEPGQIQAEVIERPSVVEDEHLTYLDKLRDSGETNMYGARPYLQREFGLDKTTATTILMYWQESFAERHPVKEGQQA
jgi:hypothetical protein